MRFEALRMLRVFLGHGTYGVNALRTAVPVAGGGGTVPPAVALIVDENENVELALGTLPQGTYPCLLVTCEEPYPIRPGQARGLTTDASLVATIRYGVQSVDTADRLRDAARTMRCVHKCLEYFRRPEGAASRVLDSVQIFGIEEWTSRAGTRPLKDGFLIGERIDVTLTVRDIWLE